MSFKQELNSFKSPPTKEVAPVPDVGVPAPASPLLTLQHDKPTVIVFLRNCGDPFAEKTFRALTKVANAHPELHCVAVSHSSREATDKWIVEVGGQWEVEVVVDEERSLYAAWGLGLSTYWHAMSPWTLYSTFRLGKDEGIWNRGAESGTRWQTSGVFAVDAVGTVQWSHVAKSADDIPDFDEVLKSVGIQPAMKGHGHNKK